MPTAPKKVRVRNEDPEKVKARQEKYRASKKRLDAVISPETYARYEELKENLTHDEFLNVLLDKFQAK